MDLKYISETPDGYKVDIRKSGFRITKTFSYRQENTLDSVLAEAISWRDRTFYSVFGYLPEKDIFRYGKKRINSQSKYKGYELPPRVSIETRNGKAYYFTVTIGSRKIRFSISKLGERNAYIKAVKTAASNIQ